MSPLMSIDGDIFLLPVISCDLGMIDGQIPAAVLEEISRRSLIMMREGAERPLLSVYFIGILLALTIGVYLQEDISRSWGYGFSLMLFEFCFLIFIAGVKDYRHKLPAGSFLTSIAQVLGSSFRKWKAEVPADPKELYNPALGRFKVKIGHSSKLRFLDRPAFIDEVDKIVLVAGRPNPWRLCSVTQVEESKRLIQFLPVWITLVPVTLVFSQIGPAGAESRPKIRAARRDPARLAQFDDGRRGADQRAYLRPNSAPVR
ncbi:unnamed protein product [Calypogeia fissa]